MSDNTEEVARSVAEQFAAAAAELRKEPTFLYECLILAINEEICTRMDLQGLSVADMAERLGVKPKAFRSYLKAAKSPTLLDIVKVAHIVGCTIDVRLVPIEKAEETDCGMRIVHHPFAGIPDGLEEEAGIDKCGRCLGCGQIADSKDGEPWVVWLTLPSGSDLAVRVGLVKPIPCPDCKGTGQKAGKAANA